MKGLFSPFLQFERRRLCGDRRNLLFLALLVLLAAYFIFSGIIEYRRFLRDEKSFLEFEQDKVKQYVNYAQYANYGFRLLYQPAPLIVFFTNSNVLEDVSSTIDTSEIINISHSFKGKSLFLNRGYFKDFSGIVFLLGSLFMLYLGVSSLVGDAYLKLLLKSLPLSRIFVLITLSRLLVINLVSGLLLGLAFLLPRFWGIRPAAGDLGRYLGFALTVLFFLTFCYLLGTLLALAVKFRRAVSLWLIACWFMLVFFTPELARINLYNRSRRLPSNDQVNIEKLKLLMSFERQVVSRFEATKNNSREWASERNQYLSEYLNNVFLFIKNYEMKLHDETKRLIDSYETSSLFVPSSFFYLVAGEISSKGYYGYIDFLETIIRLRHDFLKYYIRKYYFTSEKTIEPFVKQGENIYLAHSRLPRSFWLGIVLTVAYCAGLIWASLRLLKKRIFHL